MTLFYWCKALRKRGTFVKKGLPFSYIGPEKRCLKFSERADNGATPFGFN